MSVGTTSPVTIVNATIVGNSAPGPVAFVGGIVVGATNALTLRNVILAHNTGGNVWNPWNISRQVAGSNVIQYPRYRPLPSGQEEPPAVGSALQWADPQVAAPAWNGGSAPTAAIGLGSLAHDAGSAVGAPAADQRGVPHVGAPDLGAYEVSDDLIFADGFASGDLSAWSSSQADGGDLAVGPALGPLTPGLEAAVDDVAGLFVVDETPGDEDRYRARFTFDPSGFDPGQGELHFRTRIFIAFEADPNRRLAALVLRRQAGAYSLMARARVDDGAQADTPFVTIAAGPHAVEIDWRRASAPGASDGSLQMWIDGAPAGTLSGLENHLSAVDFVRLGALSVKSGAAGRLLFDEFESRRQSAIGP
jgi:hypothetical protein